MRACGCNAHIETQYVKSQNSMDLSRFDAYSLKAHFRHDLQFKLYFGIWNGDVHFECWRRRCFHGIPFKLTSTLWQFEEYEFVFGLLKSHGNFNGWHVNSEQKNCSQKCSIYLVARCYDSRSHGFDGKNTSYTWWPLGNSRLIERVSRVWKNMCTWLTAIIHLVYGVVSITSTRFGSAIPINNSDK